MKNILMMMVGLALTFSAMAGGPKVASTGRIGGAPAKVIVVRPYTNYGYGFGGGYYSPFYSPFYGYNRFYYSPFGYQRRPSKLDLEVAEITNDYHYEIADVRHDKTLSKTERRQKIRDLRHERQSSILEAKKTYYEKRERADME